MDLLPTDLVFRYFGDGLKLSAQQLVSQKMLHRGNFSGPNLQSLKFKGFHPDHITLAVLNCLHGPRDHAGNCKGDLNMARGVPNIISSSFSI